MATTTTIPDYIAPSLSTNSVPHFNFQGLSTPTPTITATTLETSPAWPPAVDQEALINTFYSNFYASHPFLVPRRHYTSQNYPDYLNLTICFIGSHYTNHQTLAATSILHDAVATATALAPPDPQTVHRVQALTLYATILHARHESHNAQTVILRAATIALALGMDSPSFAQDNAAGNPLVEESLRRTWWELYIIDLYIAALHRQPTCGIKGARKSSVKDYHLPNSQLFFEAGLGDPHPLTTLRTFEDRAFASNSTRMDQDPHFSSHGYRVEAIRLVDRVMCLSETANTDKIEATDAALAAWRLHSSSSPPLITPGGDIDPLLFQAHFFIHTASIFLHFPRSDLPLTVPSSSQAIDTTCAKAHTRLTSSTSGAQMHTMKAVAASRGICSLAAIPWPLELHSPFFVCAVILACIVQLAAASVSQGRRSQDVDDGKLLEAYRDRVLLLVWLIAAYLPRYCMTCLLILVLQLGALRLLGERWAVAQSALHYLRLIAEGIFTTREQSLSDIVIADAAQADDFTNVSWFDLFTPDELEDTLVFG
ncbi:hypothetical protein LTR56_012375 [Elasticomyces elasticus]|nr:hypothetical protein LTR56_012375 [Elasticomyces elasticus]KAK3652335.1 hypothetical protein LTR22_011689 [Elasticomyces elasticus]KAK4918993.1 hypothetical protein LTR49_013310 [Elasticomyces elasticus]KAK5756656.1 hypothetical protein LTS12_013246 [Elasticomyces elasticus]